MTLPAGEFRFARHATMASARLANISTQAAALLVRPRCTLMAVQISLAGTERRLSHVHRNNRPTISAPRS